ncbi:hypothetical protein TYRP_013916 [Tyrophagus putrescentiae]|nr:hypothetical protein TYRP_013916 [Tyrophagus putrescentiae]
MCNARRLGPCERSEQGPRRRALHIAPRCTAQGGEVWLHLGDCQRPSPRALRAERARSEAAGVGGRPSEARVSRRSSYRICLAVHGTKRRGLASLTYQERPPTRVSRAERARPEAAGVLGSQVKPGHDLVAPPGGRPDLLGLNGLGHFVPLVLAFQRYQFGDDKPY